MNAIAPAPSSVASHVASRFAPDIIAAGTGAQPQYLVTGGDQLFAARWQQDACWLPFHGAAHHVLVLHENGSTAVRKYERGKLVASRSRLGSVSFIPCDGTEWEIGGRCGVVHLYIGQALIARVAAEEGLGPAAEIDPFFAIRDPWLQGFFQMLVSEVELYGSVPASPDSLLLSQSQHLLAHHLVRRHCAPGRGALPRTEGARRQPVLTPRQLRRVTEHIDAHLATPLGLADLAGLVHLSQDHFIRSFKAASGMAPYQYLLRRRLEGAAELLRTSDLPVEAVAARMGFGSAAYFSTRFRAFVGVAPSAYRRMR